MNEDNGLSIQGREFKKLPVKQQMVILYENTEKLKSMITGYKLQQRLQWASILFLGTLFGFKDKLSLLIWGN
jgi:predicted amidophosphoribosyltransferase